LAQQLVGTLFQLLDLIGEIEIAALGQMLQLLDLAFELADRFFEVEYFFDSLKP